MKYLLFDKPVPYLTFWQWQKALLAEKLEQVHNNTYLTDYCLLMEHTPVYTLGKTSTLTNIKFKYDEKHTFDLFRNERGGEATYHGPGQLMLYPLLDLRNYKKDLRWYVHSLEEVIIQLLDRKASVVGVRDDINSGVFVGKNKISAIGIGASRWLTAHGCSINVHVDDLDEVYARIIPCGLTERGVTSLHHHLLREKEGSGLSVQTLRYDLIDIFNEVFDIQESSITCHKEGTENEDIERWLEQLVIKHDVLALNPPPLIR